MRKNRTAAVIPFPATVRERNKIRRSALARRIAQAIKDGMMDVNKHERDLVLLVRWTSFHGRRVVYDVARQMQHAHPWIVKPAGGGRHG